MAVIVEDGTIVDNANSYLSKADATTYHALFGNTTWNDRTDLQDVALIRATQAADIKFGESYNGKLINSTQPLLWPRTTFVDSNGRTLAASVIHQELKDYVAEAALVFVNNPGIEVFLPDPNKSDRIIAESKSIGGAVSKSFTYSGPTFQSKTKKANMILRPLLTGSTTGFELIRG